ncbi:hypothetical protein [Streptomyces globisporus]|uniref:hypothetical protein n=1 Tax=Streptomyces globisporus TaxID=1908 RepID=UPI0004C99732|nr:hypothetical protein [Streptomyces globisporus]
MPTRTITALLLAVALAAGGFAGWSALTAVMGFSDCEGSEERVERLRSIALLDAPPKGATEPRGYEGVEAGCWEDSGYASVQADRTYAFSGTPAEVIEHYRAAAAQDGWRPGWTRRSVPDVPVDLCFTRSVDGTPTVLTVSSLTPRTLAWESGPVPPELATGSGFRVEATADVEGEAIDCED